MTCVYRLSICWIVIAALEKFIEWQVSGKFYPLLNTAVEALEGFGFSFAALSALGGFVLSLQLAARTLMAHKSTVLGIACAIFIFTILNIVVALGFGNPLNFIVLLYLEELVVFFWF